MFKLLYVYLIFIVLILNKLDAQKYFLFVNLFDKSNLILLFFFKKILFVIYWAYLFLFNNEYFYIVKKQNFALINILSFYHPFLFFLFFKSYFFRITSLSNTKLIMSKMRFFFNYESLLVSFLLGIWWSSQELLWGGFWNWDFVEYVFFLSCVVILYIKHTGGKYFFFKKKISLHIQILLFFYFLINRTNFIVSQHSFSTSKFFSLSLNFLVIISLIVSVFIFLKLKNSSKDLMLLFFLLNLLILIVVTLFMYIFKYEFKKIFLIKFLLIYIYIYVTIFLRSNLMIFFYKILLFTLFFRFFFFKYQNNRYARHFIYLLFFSFVVFFFNSKSVNNLVIFYYKKLVYFIFNLFFSEIFFNKNNIIINSSINFPSKFSVVLYQKFFYFYINVYNIKIQISYLITEGFSFLFVIFFSKIINKLKTKNGLQLYVYKGR